MNQQKASELTEKLLKSAAGREILGKRLNLKLETQPQEELPVVAILVPCYDTPTAEMANALALMMEGARGKAITYTGPVIRDSSVVHWARNMLLAELIKTQRPWTHVLFIDDDIVPPADSIPRMLAHKKDIVAGVCTKRTDPPTPNIRWFDEEDLSFREIYDWPRNKLIEVGAVGTGFMLISRNALEQVADAFFNCKYEIERFGLSEERVEKIKQRRLEHFDKTANAFWFRFLEGLQGCNEYGEDISFCLMAKRYCNIPVNVDTSIQPAHIGRYGYSVEDFFFQRDAAVAKAKAEGTYKEPRLREPKYTSKISILLPTRNRSKNVERLVESLKKTSGRMPEVVLYADDDDLETALVAASLGVKCVVGPRRTLSQCWNECAKVATGNILMQAGDDLIFRTPGWDSHVAKAFEEHPDKLIFVHGDDGYWGDKFGTHGFLHRNWIDAVGYFVAPYFASDYSDTWWNDVSNALGRRVYLPFETEHLHPLFGKAEWDKTHEERLYRQKEQNSGGLYEELKAERLADIEKLRAIINGKSNPVGQPVLAAV